MHPKPLSNSVWKKQRYYTIMKEGQHSKKNIWLLQWLIVRLVSVTSRYFHLKSVAVAWLLVNTSYHGHFQSQHCIQSRYFFGGRRFEFSCSSHFVCVCVCDISTHLGIASSIFTVNIIFLLILTLKMQRDFLPIWNNILRLKIVIYYHLKRETRGF